LAAVWLSGCALPHNPKLKQSVTGYITGIVEDSKGRPVSGARVEGLWLQRWTIVFLPPGLVFVNCQTTTDLNGHFAFNATHKLDKVYAETTDNELNGQLDSVKQMGNIIRLYPFRIDRLNVR
jgi:hypothetical protein